MRQLHAIPKVRELNLPVDRQEDVVALDVAVHARAGVEEGQRTRDLASDVRYRRLVKLHGRQNVAEGPAAQRFHHDPKILFPEVRPDVVDNVRVPREVHHGDLVFQGRDVRRLPRREPFDSDLPPGLPLHPEIHRARRPLSDNRQVSQVQVRVLEPELDSALARLPEVCLPRRRRPPPSASLELQHIQHHLRVLHSLLLRNPRSFEQGQPLIWEPCKAHVRVWVDRDVCHMSESRRSGNSEVRRLCFLLAGEQRADPCSDPPQDPHRWFPRRRDKILGEVPVFLSGGLGRRIWDRVTPRARDPREGVGCGVV
mmetsp:Transcript_70590/g.161824  ORF Transcript_70590/g.161824 Transcript_70590/m.161824 type:complete len:312 (+) Transcript_70590:625-1560(+)